MTAFVESCIDTTAGSAVAAERSARGQPRFRKLLKILGNRHNVLITTHQYPDPDALASCIALRTLLAQSLPETKFNVAICGEMGHGLNDAFIRNTDVKILAWDQINLSGFDAFILLDVQPGLSYSPLPPEIEPIAVIDHHRARGRKPRTPFCDIRTDAGATGSIIFSYFMEMEQPIAADLAALLLYAIESDLAGAAGQPGELDNIALSSLTLLANTRKLYQMRYVDLPQSYYQAYAEGLSTALIYGDALVAHLDDIDSPEKPAVLGDFLLRYDQVSWALVTAIYDHRLVISLRTSSGKLSAADMIRKLLRGLGEGGGHRTKAGGFIPLETESAAEVDRARILLRRRYLRALHIPQQSGRRLVQPR